MQVSCIKTFFTIASYTPLTQLVITELQGLKNNAEVGNKAETAETAITKAIKSKRDIRILTSKGSDVTKRGFMRERFDRDDDHQNLDDVISRTTKLVAANRRASLGSMSPAEPAVLLTDDANLRLKSNVRGITAIGTAVLRRFLDHKNASQKLNQRRHQLQPQPPEPRVYIKSEQDDVDIEMSDAPMIESFDVKNAHDDPFKREQDNRFKSEHDIIRYTAP